MNGTSNEPHLRVLVHDYSGHPFQLQLSRGLAAAGHEVVHQYCASYSTGKGAVVTGPEDPAGLSIEGLAMSSEFARYNPAKRVGQELAYGWRVARYIRRSRPDVAVMCNIPLLAHAVAAFGARSARVPMVFWHQDVYSHAIGTAARRRLGRVVGGGLATVADRIERSIARASAQVVAIAEDFRPVLARWGVAPERVRVIPNWAALEEVPQRPRDNSWAREHGLVERETVVYTGTLGLKHDPTLFSELATALRERRPQAVVVVVSEGQGRAVLDAERERLSLDNLMLLDYQPYDVLPDVLGSADVLAVVLEPDASRYSVPSKALNYACAGRAVLAVMPRDNAAAGMLADSGAGSVVDPSFRERVIVELEALLDDPDRRVAMGAAGRGYAERHFDIARIVGQFNEVLHLAAGRELVAPYVAPQVPVQRTVEVSDAATADRMITLPDAGELVITLPDAEAPAAADRVITLPDSSEPALSLPDSAYSKERS
jgi:colanic acid biosynthesis glycosyl transferase WcaI